jgi:hypothetical protein
MIWNEDPWIFPKTFASHYLRICWVANTFVLQRYVDTFNNMKLRIKLPPIKSWDFLLSSVKIRIDSARHLNDDWSFEMHSVDLTIACLSAEFSLKLILNFGGWFGLEMKYSYFLDKFVIPGENCFLTVHIFWPPIVQPHFQSISQFLAYHQSWKSHKRVIDLGIQSEWASSHWFWSRLMETF